MKVTMIQETEWLYRGRKRRKGNRTRVIGQIRDDYNEVSQSHIHMMIRLVTFCVFEGVCCDLRNKLELLTTNSRKTTRLCSTLVTSQMARYSQYIN